MKVVHILRKYRPDEWGGTETAVKRLLDGLKAHDVESVVAAPATNVPLANDPFAAAGHRVDRFKAFLPVLGLTSDQRSQLMAVGGNLMSLDLFWKLRREPGLSVIHTHALNRLGGVAMRAARLRKIPCVVTIHGGYLDLPENVKRALSEPLKGGVEWGKIFGPILRSRQVVAEADAIITCNPREAELLREKIPGQRIMVQPHGVPIADFEVPQKAAALQAFPTICDRQVLLVLGRIDPVKNQGWVVQHMREIAHRFPSALLVLAGAATDQTYAKSLKKEIRRLGLESHVLMTGGLPPMAPSLIGLIQSAKLVIVPSLSETFGLTILESWAAQRPVLSTNTSGALSLIQDRQNGLLFDLSVPQTFHEKVRNVLENPAWAADFGMAGLMRARAEFDTTILARRVKDLYQELISKSKKR
jgi:starch synthase